MRDTCWSSSQVACNPRIAPNSFCCDTQQGLVINRAASNGLCRKRAVLSMQCCVVAQASAHLAAIVICAASFSEHAAINTFEDTIRVRSHLLTSSASEQRLSTTPKEKVSLALGETQGFRGGAHFDLWSQGLSCCEFRSSVHWYFGVISVFGQWVMCMLV